MPSASSADALSQVRAILRDTRMPTSSPRASSSAQHRPRHGVASRPPAPGQKFIRKRTVERKMLRQLKKQGLQQQYRLSMQQQQQREAETASRASEAEEKQQDDAEEQSSASRKKRRRTSQPQPQPSTAAPLPVSSSTRFFSLLSSSASGSGFLDAERDELAYLEAKLGLTSAAGGGSREKLRREMDGDGLGEIFELVEGIETRLSDTQRQQSSADDEGMGHEDADADAEQSSTHRVVRSASQRRTRTEELRDDDEVDAESEDEEAEAEWKEEEEGDDEDDEDQLLPEPDAAEMAEHYRRDEEDEQEDDGEEDDEEREEEEDGGEDGDGSTDEEEGMDADEEKAAASGTGSRARQSRDDLYGFNAPTPPSLIAFKQGSSGLSLSSSTLRNAASTAPAKYIPPHLRNRTADTASSSSSSSSSAGNNLSSSSFISITPPDAAVLRSLTGLLNRLTAENVEPITGSVSELFASHPRAEVNRALCYSLLSTLTSAASASSLPSTFLLSTSALLHLLHFTSQHETLAFVVEQTLLTFHSLFTASASSAAACNNLLSFLCHLLLFGLISPSLLFELLRLLSRELTETTVQLTVTVMQQVGSELRKEDPAAMKDVVMRLQTAAAQQEEQEEAKAADRQAGGSSRFAFLLSVVNDVKNNRQRFHELLDAVSPLRHALLNVAKRRQRVRQTAAWEDSRRLSFGLDDVLQAKERGRWWVVGAAYRGRAEAESAAQEGKKAEAATQAAVVDAEGEVNYLQLARQQGYHLPFDVRAFCLLMSSSDYLQAVEALEKQLRLRTGAELRKLAAVLMDCVRRSRHPNPFFAHVALHLLQHHRAMRFTVQLTVWDTLTAVAALPASSAASAASARNVGCFLSLLLLSPHCPSLSVLLRRVEWENTAMPVLVCLHALMQSVMTARGNRGEQDVTFVFSRMRGGGDEDEQRVIAGVRMFLLSYLMPIVSAADKKAGGGRTEEEKARDALMAARIDLALRLLSA